MKEISQDKIKNLVQSYFDLKREFYIADEDVKGLQ